MGKGFDRLAVGGLTLGAASMALGGVAHASTVAMPLTLVADGITYSTITAATSCDAFTGAAFFDAAQTGAPSLTDAFSGAFCYAVNGVAYVEPDGNVKLGTNSTGTKVKGSPVTIGGLKRNWKLTFFSGAPIVRGEFIVKNTGVLSTSVTMVWDNEMADVDPAISGTENGDATYDPALDSWLAVDQEQAVDFEFEVLLAPGDGWGTPTEVPAGASDGFTIPRTLTLPAGSKVRVVVFAYLGSSTAELLGVAPSFSGPSLPSTLTGSMSDAAKAQTLNWAL